MTSLARPLRAGVDVIGGLVDIAPLERLVQERIPWDHLRTNLDRDAPSALCISCTQLRTARATVFMDGKLADTTSWQLDPNAHAEAVEIRPRNARGSAAILFFFPAVRLGNRFYVDGGLRISTPLSPALRLGCERVLVIGLRHPVGPE